MINVLLFESHYRSRSWFLALKELSNLHIVSVLKEERQLFLEQGVVKNRVLNLANFDSDEISLDTAIKYITAYEKKNNVTFMNYILMDRTLRSFDYEYVIKYLYYIHSSILGFIKKNKIKAIFIEPTWTHELIVQDIAKELNVKYFAPVREKIDGASFYLFKSILRDDFLLRNNNIKISKIRNQSKTAETITPYFDHFLNRNKITLNKFNVLLDLLRLKFFGFHNKHIHPSLFSHLTGKLMAIARYYTFLLFLDFFDISKLNKKFILLTLHVQPEAGIDVIGSKFANQLEYIRQVAMGTPADYIILVKEHPHDFGRRNLSFYSQLKLIPNVKIIHPLIKTNKIYGLNNLSLVVSVAGTSSLEAALRGIPAVTSAKMYYHPLMIVDEFNPFTMKICDILKASQKNRKTQAHNLRLYNKIFKNAFEGICVDYKTDIRALDNLNIERLRIAFNEAINTL